MNTTQFIWNNQGFCENPNFEGFEIINNFNFEDNYGSMLGLIDEESLNKPPPERGHKEEGSEIDGIPLLRTGKQSNSTNGFYWETSQNSENVKTEGTEKGKTLWNRVFNVLSNVFQFVLKRTVIYFGLLIPFFIDNYYKKNFGSSKFFENFKNVFFSKKD